MRTAAKTDRNHPQIMAAFRAAGCSVADTSKLGKGFPDLCVGFCGNNYLFEVKDGNKPPSRRRLTKDETAFRDKWRGHYMVIESVEEVIAWRDDVLHRHVSINQ